MVESVFAPVLIKRGCQESYIYIIGGGGAVFASNMRLKLIVNDWRKMFAMDDSLVHQLRSNNISINVRCKRFTNLLAYRFSYYSIFRIFFKQWNVKAM